MGVDCEADFGGGALKGFYDGDLCQELGCVGADDGGAEYVTRICVRDDLGKAVVFTDCLCLADGAPGDFADHYLVALFTGLFLCEAEACDLRLDTASREVTVQGEAVTLRAKEFDLLTAFLRHQGVVLDRERLLQLVWGANYFGDTRTIDVHVAWLREKLGKAEGGKIETVWGVGYNLVVTGDAAES